jgi:hypothetical protein
LIVDAQSVKNTDTAKHKGYDAGKKVSGIKRHIAVDTQGFPHAVAVSTAEVQGPTPPGAEPSGRWRLRGRSLCEEVREILGEHVTVRIAKRNELHIFQFMPKRWIVERSFAWLEKNRRLWKNCERLLNTRLQFIHLAFLSILLNRL